MKKLSILLVVLAAVLTLTACHRDKPDESDDPTLPEGAISLTLDNFSDYFDIKVTTDCEDDYTDDKRYTLATSYIAVVPRAEYSRVVGEISFKVNSTVKRSTIGSMHVAIGEKKLLLDEGVTNDYYQMRLEGEYSPDSSTNSADLVGVYGYIVPGEREKNELEKLTEYERMSSADMLAELTLLLDAFKTELPSATSYNYGRQSSYDIISIYGDGRSKQRSSSYGGAVDRTNGRYNYNTGVYGDSGVYYTKDGVTYVQSVNPHGLVEENAAAYTTEELEELLTPALDEILDTGAIYVSVGKNTYEAYTTLKDMQDCAAKEYICSVLENYGLTAKWSEFIVRLSYSVGDGGFWYIAELVHTDTSYPTEYYDHRVSFSIKIGDTNNTSVSLFSPSTDRFALADTLEDAMLFKNGLVELGGGVSNIPLAVYGDGSNLPFFEYNFLPILITEGGLYDLSLTDDRSIILFDSEGAQINETAYIPEGMYYLKISGIPEGVTDIVLSVDALILEDYGDLTDPIPIVDNSFTAQLEVRQDMAAFSYTPANTGVYSLTPVNGISVSIYRADSLDEYFSVSAPNTAIYLEAEIDYVFAVSNYNDGKFTYRCDIVYVADPEKNYRKLSTEWSEELIVFNDFDLFCIDVTSVGYYAFEYDIDGDIDVSRWFADENGKMLDVTVVEGEDGQKLYALTPGRYYYKLNLDWGSYLCGRLRFALVKEGVSEQTDLTVPTDEYITLTTSCLTTVGSYSVFRFEITEKATLLCVADSNRTGMSLYRSDGTVVGVTVYPLYSDTEFGVECYSYRSLAPGEYYIVIEHTEPEPAVHTVTVRLKVD